MHKLARSGLLSAFALAVTIPLSCFAQAVQGGSHSAPPVISGAIDNSMVTTLQGNVRADLTPDLDLGPVEDAMPLRLFLVLRRSPERQAALDNLIARQQQPTAPEYHQWLTPKEYGERFGVSELDIQKIAAWLASRGMKVDSVMNNAASIVFTTTAGDVRETFHTQLHYFNVAAGKHSALVQDPSIPSALSNVVVGIAGLNKIPLRSHHTQIHPVAYDAATHSWHDVETGASPGMKPKWNAGGGNYNETPQDFYTIYNVNKIFASGNLGAGRTIAVPEPTDMTYGAVNGSTGAAAGGDVATFRKVFGVPGTLNMHVYHGYGTVPCNDPGITDAGSAGEATLDAEWSNALAPSANLIFMSCDSNPDNGVDSSIAALVDNNLADTIGLSWGVSELGADAALFAANDAVFKQAAAQGQTIFVAAGDAGSDTNDQDTAAAATSGLNIDAYSANPLITSAGGLDFSDQYDAQMGGPAQTAYWGATNSAYYGDALGYVPETTWNGGCANSLSANLNGYSPAAYCALGPSNAAINGSVVGGGGGYSTHYAQPSYQTGTLGLSASASKRATPDIALFASNGIWGHAIVNCDSQAAATACTSSSTFGAAGGTSFVAPQMTGIGALLVNYTGSRQGLLNPALYALAKAQFTAAGTKAACYSNGQTANAGVTKGLPAASCVFNDVTTSNNDVPCAKGATGCFVNSGASYGLLSATGAASLTMAYPSGAGYDLSTGLGSINVFNLLANWNKAFTSTTGLTASLASITSTQSVTLKATVKGGTPAGSTGATPALAGTVSFAAGTTALGNCALSGGTCSLAVAGTALKAGVNSIAATFTGSRTYPASTSSLVTVTVGPATSPITLTPSSLAFAGGTVGVVSAAQTVSVKNTGANAVAITSISIAGANPTSFLELSGCGSSLAAGASCNVYVAFNPASAAALNATLSVADNASGTPQTAALTGTGIARPVVTVTPASIAFPSTKVGVTSAAQAVTVTNAGTTALTLNGIALTGANATSFTQLSTCGATLAPAASCWIYVAFKPASAAALTGTLNINDNGAAAPQTVKLTGTGTL